MHAPPARSTTNTLSSRAQARSPEATRPARNPAGAPTTASVQWLAVRNRRIVITFSVLTALFASGYGVMFTVLDDFRDTYGIADSSLGLVVAVGFFASFIAQILFAPLADRGHARQLIYIGMLLDITGLIGMAVGTTIQVLLVSRLVMGLGAGVALPAVRRIVILADPDNLGRNIGRLLAADV